MALGGQVIEAEFFEMESQVLQQMPSLFRPTPAFGKLVVPSVDEDLWRNPDSTV
jgi:hypothetical protein